MSNLPPNPYDRTKIVEPPVENPDRAVVQGSGKDFVVTFTDTVETPGSEDQVLSRTGKWVTVGTAGLTPWGGIVGDIEDQADLMAMFDTKVNTADLHPVAFSGNYNQLINKPPLGTVSPINLNGDSSQTLHGDGIWRFPTDVYAAWGNISGDINAQADLMALLNAKAPSLSPVFTGIPRAPTPSVDDNSDRIATTGWFFGQAFNGVPEMDGVGSSGDSTRWARGNHRHPGDTTKIGDAPNDGQQYGRKNLAWTVITAGGGGGTPGGADTQVQFNDAGAFGGDADFVFNKTTNTITLGITATPGKIQGAQGAATGNGTDLTVIGGAGGATSGIGGVVNITGGTGTGTAQRGGAVNINGGFSTIGGAGAKGGDVNITSGFGGQNSTGGDINIITETGSTNSIGGTITIKGKDLSGGPVNIFGGSRTGVAAGAVTIRGGLGSTSGSGGPLICAGGEGQANNAGSGAATFQGGDGTGNGAIGATATLKGGLSTRSTIGGTIDGAAVFVAGGAAAGSTNSGAGGAVSVTGGQGGISNGSGGAITILGGAGQGSGVRGNVNLGGNAAALTTTATGGFISIPSCAGAPSGTPASIPTGQIPMVYDSTNYSLYHYAGGSWRSGGGGSGLGTLSTMDWTCDDTAPSAPIPGDRWIKPATGEEMVWVPGSSGGAWLNPSSAGQPPIPLPLSVANGGTGSTVEKYLPLSGGTLSGNLAITPSAGAAGFALQAAVNTAKAVYFKSGANLRWQFESDANPEVGSNAGSDFALYRFNDAGAYISTVLSIHRATGAVTLPAQPAFHAYGGGATASGTNIVFSGTMFNVGGYYNTGSGAFSAPVAGTYFFRFNALASNMIAGEYRFQFLKNGVAYGGLSFIFNNGYPQFLTCQGSGHIYLAVGDYVTVRYISGPTTLYPDSGFSSFSGHLVG